jgi:hypothetical protein
MVVDGFPRGKVVGQLPPLGASLNQVQNGIDDAFAGMFGRTSPPILGVEVTLD